MGIKNLISLIDNKNIANDLSDHELRAIASDVLERAKEDEESMKDWMSCVDEGLELCKTEFQPKSTPWEGAANYKSTLLKEASNDFGDRASVELMRDPSLVKAEIIGLQTLQNVIDKKSDEVIEFEQQFADITEELQKSQEAGEPIDPEMQQSLQEIRAEIDSRKDVIRQKKQVITQKLQRADRVTEVMNWQVNVKMSEWRKDQKRMLYTLPNIGTLFKKTYYDESRGRCVSDIINYPNFIVNQATVSLDECRSFTHIIAIKKSICEARMRQGLWRKCDFIATEAKADTGSNEANGVENASKNPDAFYEQYCWLDLDDDGFEEPYIVTVHKASEQVVRIVARYDFDSIFVKYQDERPLPLLQAQRARSENIIALAKELGTEPILPDPTDLSDYEIVYIQPEKILTKYGFVPSDDGSFLDVGFFHLVGSLTMAENKTTNDLLNAGTLANNQMGMAAKGFKKRQGDFKFKMGQIMSTEIPADQLQNSIYMLNFKEPSPTLFSLRESIRQAAGTFVANSDAAGQIQSNTAPTTALAMIQESMKQHTAKVANVIDSMNDEFGILFGLNRKYLDNNEYRKIVGDDEASYEDDFAEDNLSVVSTANPEFSSKTQRMMLADAELAQVPLVMQAGGNPIPIIKNYFKAIGSQNIQEYFPNEAEMSPNDRAQLQQMRAAQEQANELKKQELELKAKEIHITELQTALLSRAEDRKDAEFALEHGKTTKEIEKTAKETELVQAQTVKTLADAEAISVGKDVSIAKAQHEIMNGSQDNTIEKTKMEIAAKKELKMMEIAAQVASGKKIADPEEEMAREQEEAAKEAEIEAMRKKEMGDLKEALAQLQDKITKPKVSKIKVVKNSDGSFSGEKVESYADSEL